jgi:hypothetical protein
MLLSAFAGGICRDGRDARRQDRAAAVHAAMHSPRREARWTWLFHRYRFAFAVIAVITVIAVIVVITVITTTGGSTSPSAPARRRGRRGLHTADQTGHSPCLPEPPRRRFPHGVAATLSARLSRNMLAVFSRNLHLPSMRERQGRHLRCDMAVMTPPGLHAGPIYS